MQTRRHSLDPKPIQACDHAFMRALLPRLPLPFADVMALSNAAYYEQQEVFGRQGDFITAPEISQLFGEVMALWMLHQCERLKTLTPVIIELGPGRGTLMADITRMTRAAPDVQPTLVLVEQSQRRQNEQRQTLQDIPYPLHFCNSFDRLGDLLQQIQAPHPSPILVIANEFLDALPTQPYVYHKDIWHRVDVAHAKRAGFITYQHTQVAAQAKLSRLIDPASYAIYEHSPARYACAQIIQNLLACYTGAACWVDYGDDIPPHARLGDTVQAIKNHAFVHPLAYLGVCDITTHVDFYALRSAFHGKFIQIDTQTHFLKTFGFDHRLQKLEMACASLEQRDAIQARAHRLVDVNGMGALFKVMTVQS